MAAKEKPKGRKRGRPPQGPYSDKQKVISTRVTGDIRKALEDERKRTGRSLSQEIEMRLRQSFDHSLRVEETFGGPVNYGLFRLISTAMGFVEQGTGKSWHEDAYTHAQFKQVVLTVLKTLRPKGKSEPPKELPWDIEPKSLGKAAAYGAMGQVSVAEDKPTVGMGRGALFFSTNIRRNLGHLAERIDEVIWRSGEEAIITTNLQSSPYIRVVLRKK